MDELLLGVECSGMWVKLQIEKDQFIVYVALLQFP